jgi:hypothetical protein
MVKLKPITDAAWLVISSDGLDSKIGLLSEQRDKIILLAGKVKTVFKNRKEVISFFNDDVFTNAIETKVENNQTSYFIRGFPVAHDNPTEAKEYTGDLPVYTKENSDVGFSAGYYCLDFPKCWRPAFCPKLKTLETYNFMGPFRTKEEMHIALNKKNKETRN